MFLAWHCGDMVLKDKSIEIMEQYADIGMISQKMKEFLSTYRSGIIFGVF